MIDLTQFCDWSFLFLGAATGFLVSCSFTAEQLNIFQVNLESSVLASLPLCQWAVQRLPCSEAPTVIVSSGYRGLMIQSVKCPGSLLFFFDYIKTLRYN